MDYSPPDSSVHGISQAGILGWIAISFFRGFSWSRDQTLFCIVGRFFSIWATSTNNKCWTGCGEKEETLLHCWWECKLVQPLCKTVPIFLKILKIELPFDLAIPLLGIYPDINYISETYMHSYVHSSSIYNSQDIKATSTSINRWVDKDNVTHIYVWWWFSR